MSSRVIFVTSLFLLLVFPNGLLASESLDQGIESFETGDLSAARTCF